MGPGTDVMGRLARGDRPTSYIDSVAQQHDVDFMKSSGSTLGGFADNLKAIGKAYLAPFSMQSIVMRAGLSLENLLRLTGIAKFNKALPGLTDQETRELGYEAQKYIDAQRRGATADF